MITGLQRLATRKSTKDLTGITLTKEYPPDATQYELLDDCGRGVSATVHRALCRSLGEIVAVKKMNLESLNCDLDEIIHEAQTMKNYHHPNVLPLYTSFVEGQDLWMVMPFISGGSVLHIMKYGHPEGLDEVAIATVGREVLKALEYVHKQGGIHRDIKAGNILIDKDGHVSLGDFGVAATLERGGSWGNDKVARMTFVGTPCWMAPEVMEQTSGYGTAADIWSLGITLLEMAHGHAPFAKFPPMKVLLMTLQNPPPTLDDKGKKHFSKAMRDVVSRCLQKDPQLRPTASQLLEHKFFKIARDEAFLAKDLMEGLPPLGERVQEIRQGKAATNSLDNDVNFARSQEEYKKGVSSWNFDVAALKAQAALEPDDDDSQLPTITEMDESMVETLSGFAASQAAAFVSAQTQGGVQRESFSGSFSTAPGVTLAAATAGMASAFASLSGQQQMLNATGGVIPPAPIIVPEGEGHALDVGLATSLRAGSGNVDTAVSPGQIKFGDGNISPPAELSREGSVQGALNLATTPTAAKQKMKQQGRFQIYEPGAEPPPISPPGPNLATTSTEVRTLEQSSSQKSALAGPSSTEVPVPLASRTSEDGSKRGDKGFSNSGALEATESVFDDTVGVEPKKKGRFLVMEQASLSKVASTANLATAASMDPVKSRSDAGAPPAAAQPLGRPPPAPAQPPTPSTPQLPVSYVMPKLQELLDHATQQQQALARLLSAAQEMDRTGKVPALLNRVQSKSLFDAPVRSSGGGADGADAFQVSTGGAPSTSGAAAASSGEVEGLRGRVSDLEVENTRLRHRVQQLEALLSSNTAFTSASVAGPGSTNYSPTVLSPRETSHHHISEEDMRAALPPLIAEGPR